MTTKVPLDGKTEDTIQSNIESIMDDYIKLLQDNIMVKILSEYNK